MPVVFLGTCTFDGFSVFSSLLILIFTRVHQNSNFFKNFVSTGSKLVASTHRDGTSAYRVNQKGNVGACTGCPHASRRRKIGKVDAQSSRLREEERHRHSGRGKPAKRGGNSIPPLNRVTRLVGDNDIYARQVYDVCGPPPMDHPYTFLLFLGREKERQIKREKSVENSPRGSVP